MKTSILDRIIATLFAKKTRRAINKSPLSRLRGGARVGAGLCLLAALLLAAPADATEFYWNVATGKWEVAENWNPQLLPTAADDAFIDNGGTALIEGGDTGAANDLYVGQYGSGTLEITNGGSVTANYVDIGQNANSTGTVTVDGTGSTLTVDFDHGEHSTAHSGQFGLVTNW